MLPNRPKEEKHTDQDQDQDQDQNQKEASIAFFYAKVIVPPFRMIQSLRSLRQLSTGVMKQMVSELSVPVPWGEIRGRIWGPEEGRPVLCLHGWADNAGSFNTLIPLLPKDWKLVAVDMVGHGLSSHRPEGVFYTFPAYLSDVRRVIEALQWKRFSIIGHSMGECKMCLQFSALYPEMVESVVFLDSVGFLPTDKKNIAGLVRKGIEEMIEYEKKKDEKKNRVYTYEKAVERLMAANPSLSEQSAHILLERGSTQVEGGVVFNRDFRINLTNIIRSSAEQCLELQSTIQARILVLLAEDGFMKMLAKQEQERNIRALLDGFSALGGSVVTVPGNHHVHLNSPETLASVVTDFLKAEPLSQSSDSSVAAQAAKLDALWRSLRRTRDNVDSWGTHRYFQKTQLLLSRNMPWLFLDWFVPVYLLVSVLVLAGFGACLYFLEPGLQDAHKWSAQSAHRRPLVASEDNYGKDEDNNALI
ncbi:serine hydrolase-like protein 2 isoform X1 [Arapaima gigas]